MLRFVWNLAKIGWLAAEYGLFASLLIAAASAGGAKLSKAFSKLAPRRGDRRGGPQVRRELANLR